MCKCLRVCVCACECVGGCVYDCIGSQAQCTMYVVGSLKPGHPSNFVGLGGALFGASTSLYCGAGFCVKPFYVKRKNGEFCSLNKGCV